MLAGIYQIMQTPFTDDGDIDWDSFTSQIEFAVAAGVHGLVIPALASEFFTLSDAEADAGGRDLRAGNRRARTLCSGRAGT